MSRDNGGDAFPSPGIVIGFDKNQHQQGAYGGMTLRDYFAAQYLVGRGPIDASHEGGRELLWGEMAADCYAAADALIAERAK